MPFYQAARYEVEYLCTANPRAPQWRPDDGDQPPTLQAAIGRAMEIGSRRGTETRVLNEEGVIVYQYPRPLAA